MESKLGKAIEALEKEGWVFDKYISTNFNGGYYTGALLIRNDEKKVLNHLGSSNGSIASKLKAKYL